MSISFFCFRLLFITDFATSLCLCGGQQSILKAAIKLYTCFIVRILAFWYELMWD